MVSNEKKLNKGSIVIYKSKEKDVELKTHFKNESIWLRQNEIAKLFRKDRSVITKHINNIFKGKEVDKKSNVQKMHIGNSDKQVNFYSLDVILSVGYKTNSPQAIHFRKWATKILKDYLLEGYVVNKKRMLETQKKLNELKNLIDFIEKKSKTKSLKGQEKELLGLLKDYSKTLDLLEEYDKNKIKKVRGRKTKFILEYNDCLKIIRKIKEEKVKSDIFGTEIKKKLESIVKNIYQSFSGKIFYETIENKATALLYFVIKDHPFIDGNKRIASFLFIYFLDKNNYLYRKNGERKINDNALTALALLVAQSDPKEKDQMFLLINQLIRE